MTSTPLRGGPRAVLVGAPGSGKTTVGKLLAKRWGVGFRDTDHDIERATEQTVSDIFVEHGEDHFRDLERAAVADALREHDGVLAVGGGAVMSAQTRDLLRSQAVVHLDVGLASAMRRLGSLRPPLQGRCRLLRAQVRVVHRLCHIRFG